MDGNRRQEDETSESPEPPGEQGATRFWWERSDLRYRFRPGGNTLFFGENRLEDFAARSEDLPMFVYSPARIRVKIGLLRTALPEAALFYAIKANRHPEILDTMLSHVDGIDVCSPREATLALNSGFSEDRISYTGTSLSERDLDFLTSHPSIHVNADSLSFLRRLVDRNPGRTIGVRINPEMGIGYRNESRLVYADPDRPSKFGLLSEQIPEALEIASRQNCRIETIHWHIGCGWLGNQLEDLRMILRRAAQMVARFPDAQRINLGGGLGVPFRNDDGLLPLEQWARIVRESVVDRWQIQLEPGSFLVQDAGLLLVRVNTVERKRGEAFVGVNAGFNLVPEPVFYGMRLEPVFLTLPEPDRPVEPVVLAGNINEAHDLLARDFTMPIPREGEYLALLNAGAYAASMASNHCLRGEYREAVVRSR